MKPKLLLLAMGLQLSCLYLNAQQPNVIIILADDLGYGDVGILNKQSTIPTPNMDKLGSEGMIFTDAHSGSAVCTPTRYGLMTGRYSWRTKMKRGVLNGYSPHLIDPQRTTIADLFQKSGYTTACVGKWHLGMDFPFKHKLEGRPNGEFYVEAADTIQNSPLEYGFDYFYGISASLDFPPYLFIENDKFDGKADKIFAASGFPKYIRKGEGNSAFVPEDCLDILTSKATDFIRRNKDSPFFLYFPITAPHKPVAPHERFKGKSDLGPYGDFVNQVDWTIGQVTNLLDELQLADNTLVILTSDNGSFMRRTNDNPKFSVSHSVDHTMQAYDPDHHTSNYIFRGTKADVWEGGHRVPFLVRWPEKIANGTTCAQNICLTDLFATSADILGLKLNRKVEGEDSFSFLRQLKGKKSRRKDGVINHSATGMFAFRHKGWKLILGNGSGGREPPTGKAFTGPYQLYRLDSNVEESLNVYHQQPKMVRKMLSAFDRIYERTEAAIKHPGKE